MLGVRLKRDPHLEPDRDRQRVVASCRAHLRTANDPSCEHRLGFDGFKSTLHAPATAYTETCDAGRVRNVAPRFVPTKIYIQTYMKTLCSEVCRMAQERAGGAQAPAGRSEPTGSRAAPERGCRGVGRAAAWRLAARILSSDNGGSTGEKRGVLRSNLLHTLTCTLYWEDPRALHPRARLEPRSCLHHPQC